MYVYLSTYLHSSYLFSYQFTDIYETYLLPMELVTKAKPNINWVKVHPQLRHLVDGWWCVGGCWFTMAPLSSQVFKSLFQSSFTFFILTLWWVWRVVKLFGAHRISLALSSLFSLSLSPLSFPLALSSLLSLLSLSGGGIICGNSCAVLFVHEHTPPLKGTTSLHQYRHIPKI
jgi:hypothetical protein